MTLEDKKLLIIDLCARSPYGVKVRYSSYKEFITCILHSINPIYNTVDLWSKNACFNPVSISKIKPYLFPMSSMTEEQKKELEDTLIEMSLKAISDELNGEDIVAYEIDFYNKHHIDYRRLIEKSLAIDATGLNIY